MHPIVYLFCFLKLAVLICIEVLYSTSEKRATKRANTNRNGADVSVEERNAGQYDLFVANRNLILKAG